MQPKSQISSSYSAHRASAPGAQQLSLTSPITLHRPCSLRSQFSLGYSAQRPQRPEPSISEELDYSAQAMQPKSQISSGYSSHKASTPEAQKLSFMSSTTLLRPCSQRVRSAQAIQPTRPQRLEPNNSV